MSTVTDPRSTAAAPAAKSPRRPHLSGMTWLVWRQHRAAYWTLVALTLACLAGVAWQRSRLTDYLAQYGWPHLKGDEWVQGFNAYSQQLAQAGLALSCVPVLLAVFVGAPLLAPDLESGTAKLVAAQSVSRVRWIGTKLVITGVLLVAGMALISAAYTWWWAPVKSQAPWTDGIYFNTTGPVAVALTVFLVALGVLVGMLARRTLTAMVVTFFVSIAVEVAWSLSRMNLGSTITATTHHAAGLPGDQPALPAGAYEIDSNYVTGSGKLMGWGTCAHEANEKAVEVCLRKADVVGWSTDYLPISQLSSMQWLGAGILFGLTAVVVAVIVVRGRRRLV